MEFKGYIVSGLLVMLFTVGLLSFGASLSNNYNKDQTYMNTPYLDSSRIEQQLNETAEDAESWGNSFRSDNIFISLGSIVLFSLFGIGKLMWTATMTFFTIYFDIMQTLFGLPVIVTGTLTAIIIIGLMFGLWRIVKQG